MPSNQFKYSFNDPFISICIYLDSITRACYLRKYDYYYYYWISHNNISNVKFAYEAVRLRPYTVYAIWNAIPHDSCAIYVLLSMTKSLRQLLDRFASKQQTKLDRAHPPGP